MKREVKSFRNALKERGISRLYYICDFLNVPSIFQKGILSRKLIQRKNIKFNDISYSEFQKYRNHHMRKNYKKDIHDFVCLFFTPHTPMLRHVCFEQYKDNKVAILQLNTNIVDNVYEVYFTDKSCTRRDFKMFRDIEDLDNLNWEYLTKDYDYLVNNIESDEKDEFKGYRGAEVLIPDRIDPSYIIRENIVKSQEAKSALADILKKNKIFNVQINIDVYKFPLRHGSSAYGRKMRKFK